MNDLSDKIALVTGASRGIGAAIAIDLARAGASVVINYVHSNEKAEAVRAEIIAAGGQAITVKADMANGSEIAVMFAQIRAELGEVDILVNNAAVETRIPSLDFPSEEYDRIMDTNLKACFLCCQQALPSMKAKGWGRVINISSVHEIKPTGFCTPYSMTKGGLFMMTRELAFEFSQYGITVNNIAPGAIRTDMNRSVLADPEYEARVIAKTPARLIGDPYDIARAATFLAVPEARFITGTTLFIDGGLTL
ncbi:MAG: glucose 1-dehydrogenase [Gloeobacteraceae cyanobacterium ES-bin-144]|nr:glucose 1-dehydrogenase [Verrucomicrobiales bacterium]